MFSEHAASHYRIELRTEIFPQIPTESGSVGIWSFWPFYCTLLH